MIEIIRKTFLLNLRICILSLISFGMVSVVSSTSNAGLILQGNDPQHIALGAQFGAVGWVDTSGGQGSFSVIDDGRWGLTSKHVLLNDLNDPSSLRSNIQVGFGNYSTSRNQVTSAFDIYIHPTRDVALFHFANVFNGVTPLQRFTGDVVNGMEGFSVGYGLRQYVDDPITTFTGDRRAGFDVVDGINLFEPENFRTNFNRSFNSNYRTLEMGLRPGDSGGAFILADTGQSTNLLAGINDSASLQNGYNSFSFYERIPNAWIDQTQLTAVPEPGSAVLIGTALTVILGTFRKRRKGLVIASMCLLCLPGTTARRV